MYFFEKFWPPQKNLSTRPFIPFLKYQVTKIILNNLLQTLCNLIVTRIFKEGEFYNKFLDWGCVNKWGYVDLENVSGVGNTKMSEITPLSIADVESLWAISFLVKSS